MSEETLLSAARRMVRFFRIDESKGGITSIDTIRASETLDKMVKRADAEEKARQAQAALPAPEPERKPEPAPAPVVDLTTQRQIAQMKGYEGVACTMCGNFTMVRNGTCLKCDTCGSTTGCS